jgi:PAS domain S-box-containing protein
MPDEAISGGAEEGDRDLTPQSQAVQERDAAETKFRRLTDAAPFLMWVSNTDALCVYFNRAWLEFRGRTMDQETGNGWTEGLHPDDRDLCIGTYLKAFSARQAFRMQFRLQRYDGDYRWVEDFGMPTYDQDAMFSGFMGACMDITSQKRTSWTPDEVAMRAVFSLTERERQVLVLIADGHSTKDAATRLGISYKTADLHRSRILEKLGVHETASMVRVAIRAGLIEP